MEKKKYTTPECEVFHILEKTNILYQTRYTTSEDPNNRGTNIVEGDPSGNVHLAKPHSNWDDDAQNASNDGGDLWQ